MVSEIYIFVMTTDNFKIITVESTRRMKSNAIVGSWPL